MSIHVACSDSELVIENHCFLSIVIACHNDQTELAATIESILLTSPGVEIIVVDDFSLKPIPQSGLAKVFRTQRRIGVGPARHLGAMHATGQFLFFTDAHCRFDPDWYINLTQFIGANPAISEFALLCGSCIAIDDAHDLEHHLGQYWGATFNFFGPDRKNKRLTQVFEAVWAQDKPGEDRYQIAACMGAAYAMRREWYFYLDPLRHFRSWGGDEQSLSLKAWLSGGEIRLLKNVKVGHKFRTGRVPFPVRGHETIYNKLFTIWTCLPEAQAKILQNKFPKGGELSRAIQQLQNDWHICEIERAHNRQIFTRDFASYLERFSLSFPLK